MNITEIASSNTEWFESVLKNFIPSNQPLNNKNPKELIKEAGWKSFGISTLSALPPGLLGWATLLPELVGITKVQINLVYAIAQFYGKEGKVNTTIVAYLFANQLGLRVAESMSEKVGQKLVIHIMSSQMLQPLIKQIAKAIGMSVTQKLIGRWVPFLLAPIFGAYSKKMTEKIGHEAIKLFSSDFEIEEEIL